MKKILALAYEYFPTENANTRIIRNVCALLAERCGVDLVTVQRPGTEAGPSGDGKVRVIRVPGYTFHKAQRTGKVTPAVFARMAAAKVQGKLRHDETVLIQQRMFEHEIRKAVKAADYDAMVSFSAPFLTHCCASRIAAESGVPWIAVCFDPFFSNRIYDPGRMDARKKLEEEVMAPAAKVILTFPTDRDYLRRGVAFREKIIGIGLPGIVRRAEDAPGEEHEGCVCSFFGSMYKDIRDPGAAIALMERVSDEIETRFIGHVDDAEAGDFFPEGCRCKYLGEKSGAELAEQYAEADVLMNIGNSVGNQMPSKIFEYISTGKPILNIVKSPECPTLRALEKYPARLNLTEEEIQADPDGCAEKVKEFCRAQKGKRVPADEVMHLYADHTYAYFAGVLERALEKGKGNH